MNFEELMNKISEVGVTKSNLEKRCGFYAGKITELSKGRAVVNAKYIQEIARALDEMSEELALLAEEARELDAVNLGQYCVYEFIFPDNKRYYGVTVNPEIRWKNGNGYKNQEVGKAIEKFGWENVEKKIIAENLTKQNAALIERTLIKATGTDMPIIGYNSF